MTPIDIAVLVAIGLLAGFSNAVVGGGTLFTFPAILAVGLSPVIANATTTVALWPGTVTSARAQLGELKRSIHALYPRVIGATVGGLIGALLLLASGDTLFFQLVPWLLAIATALFTFARQIVKRVARIGELTHGNTTALVAMEFVCAIYGGYFGAAIGILLLAVHGACRRARHAERERAAQLSRLLHQRHRDADLRRHGRGRLDGRADRDGGLGRRRLYRRQVRAPASRASCCAIW